MKFGGTQFGVSEDPASSGRHGSPIEVVPVSNRLDQAADAAATVGRERLKEHLLTVREVAALLRVPVSWVYARMRKRAPERIPAYRLGKYWRFSEGEILAWMKRHREIPHVA